MLLIIDGAGHVLVFPPLNFAKSAPLRSNVCSIGRYRFGLPASTLRCDQPPSPARVVIERRPSITVTSSPRLLYLLAIGLSCVTVLACGVGPCSAVRKPPSLAEWPSEGKSPCFLAWRGAGCGAEFLNMGGWKAGDCAGQLRELHFMRTRTTRGQTESCVSVPPHGLLQEKNGK